MKYTFQSSSESADLKMIWCSTNTYTNIVEVKTSVTATDRNVMSNGVENMVVMAFRERYATNKIFYQMGCIQQPIFF